MVFCGGDCASSDERAVAHSLLVGTSVGATRERDSLNKTLLGFFGLRLSSFR